MFARRLKNAEANLRPAGKGNAMTLRRRRRLAIWLNVN